MLLTDTGRYVPNAFNIVGILSAIQRTREFEQWMFNRSATYAVIGFDMYLERGVRIVVR